MVAASRAMASTIEARPVVSPNPSPVAGWETLPLPALDHAPAPAPAPAPTPWKPSALVSGAGGLADEGTLPRTWGADISGETKGQQENIVHI